MSPHYTATLNPNHYELLDDGTARIALTRGMYALVDQIDLRRALQCRWGASWDGSRSYYAVGRRVHQAGIRMHRLIARAPNGVLIDHEDGDTLNNRRANLRFASKVQNAANSRVNVRNRSGFRGVSWHRGAGKWQASIQFQTKSMGLGVFTSAESAAHAYDEAARQMFGEFAAVNFPVEGERAV